MWISGCSGWLQHCSYVITRVLWVVSKVLEYCYAVARVFCVVAREQMQNPVQLHIKEQICSDWL